VNAQLGDAGRLFGNVVVVDGTVSESAGNVQLSGTVQNTGSQVTVDNRLVAYIQDTDGTALDCSVLSIQGRRVVMADGTYESAIRPDEYGSFSGRTDAPAPAGSIRVWVQWRDVQGSIVTDERAWQALEAEKERAFRLRQQQ
jgi:hypothetical protein